MSTRCLWYGLSLVLHIVPWYHPGFRPPVQMANGALLVAGALAIVLVLVPAYARRQQWGWLLASLSAGLALFMGTGQANAWRLAWTDHLLQTRHCNDSTQASGSRVLGGLVRTGGLGAGDGAEYVNSTHCLFVVCREEFFPCLRPSPAQDVRHPKRPPAYARPASPISCQPCRSTANMDTLSETPVDQFVPPRQLPICLADRRSWIFLLLDPQGRQVGPAEGFLSVRGFHAPPVNGVRTSAAQALDGRWGFIDEAGAWRVPPLFEDTRNAASNGVARFRQNGLWGYMLPTGEVLTEPQFEQCRPYRNGVAAVKQVEGGWRFIDEAGAFTGDEEHDDLRDLGEAGLAWAARYEFRSKEGRRLIGFVDRQGRWVIEPTFGYAESFGPHGVAPAQRSRNAYGLIDTKGHWVLEPEYNRDMDPFDDDGLASFQITGGDYERGFMNTRGEICIAPGRYMERHRSGGFARSNYQYYRANGSRLEYNAQLCMGDDFRPLGGFAVVRLDRMKAHGDQPGQERNWALLHADGQVVPMPSSLREPLTGADGWLLPECLNTPWVPFIDQQGHVVWVDGMFCEQARLATASGGASLHTAAGEVWSGHHEALGPVKPFFSPYAEQVLVDVASMADLLPLVEQLCTKVEERLHRTAASEALEPVRDHPDADEMDEDDDDDWDDNGDESGDEEDAALVGLDWRTTRTEARQTARLLRAERRLSRHYLDESHGGHYHFLYGEWGDLSHALYEQFLQILTERFGPPNVLPEWAGWQESRKPWLGWAIPLQQPLPGDDGRWPEYRQLWICLQQSSDTGDGDGWDENWLLVAPSVDALALALRARAGPPGAPTPPDEAAAVRLVSNHPHALQALPREHLSEAVIDAALDANIEVIKQVPKHLMNSERYARAVREHQLEIRQVPLEMLDEAICMANLSYSSMSLGEIPEPWRTEAVCLEALRQTPYAIEHVPGSIRRALQARGMDLQKP